MRKYRNISIMLLLLTFVSGAALAQQSNTLFHMKGLPNANEFNPAIHRDSSNLVVGLPGVSISAGTGFAYSDLIHYGTGALQDSLVLDFIKFHDAIDDENNVVLESAVDLFKIGVRSRSYYFSFDIRDRMVFQGSFDKGLVTFLKNGNAPYLGQNVDLGNMAFNAMHYREYGFGFSNEFLNNRLTLGVRAKILYGKMNINVDKLNIQVETAAGGESLLLKAKGEANMAGPVTLTFDEYGFVDETNDNFDVADYLLDNESAGYAFDIGANYKVNKKLQIGASVIDLGSIQWSKNVYNMTQNGSYKYTGADLSQSVNDNASDYKEAGDVFEELTDSIKHGFRINNSSSKYNTPIPTKVYLSGSYQLTPKTDLGFLGRAYMFEDNTDMSMTLSANTLVGRWLSLTASYSVMNKTYDNLGIGVGARLGPLQLYMVSDKILSAMKPADANGFTFRFGINILMGRSYKRSF
ncbi:hypothetical protein EMN47_07600 [Prolixibacteraceae bacterium JC049]|nr:hypothetical protein [Prolixibacteraceae bacterium JC049]